MKNNKLIISDAIIIDADYLPLTINERNPRHRDLDYIIDIMWDQGIEEANKYLTSHGHEILRVR